VPALLYGVSIVAMTPGGARWNLKRRDSAIVAT
jgi:hypothetical protein